MKVSTGIRELKGSVEFCWADDDETVAHTEEFEDVEGLRKALSPEFLAEIQQSFGGAVVVTGVNFYGKADNGASASLLLPVHRWDLRSSKGVIHQVVSDEEVNEKMTRALRNIENSVSQIVKATLA